MNNKILAVLGLIFFAIILIYRKMKPKTIDDYFLAVFALEKGITTDTGGFTNDGVSDLADGKEDGKYFGIDLKSMDYSKKKEIYIKDYFNPFAINFVDFPLTCLNIFDLSINSGVGRAKEFVSELTGQKLLSNQRNFIRSKGDELFNELLMKRRIKYFNDLATKNPAKYSKYLKGWLNRLKKLKFL